MKVKTEEFLSLLLWSADKLARPTFRNLTDSYEGWAFRKDLFRKIASLERGQLIETRKADAEKRISRLTAEGRLCALGGRDPQARWSRKWDGRWRMVLFDIPVVRDSHRRRLRRYLHDRGFGCLQGSVWVTPDPLEEEKKILVGAKVDVASLLLLDAKPCAGESDAEIVGCAWDFERINARYRKLMKVLDECHSHAVRNEADAKAMLRWASIEREAWIEAVSHDPLLPKRILPPNYLGQIAWQRRISTLRKASARVKDFTGA